VQALLRAKPNINIRQVRCQLYILHWSDSVQSAFAWHCSQCGLLYDSPFSKRSYFGRQVPLTSTTHGSPLAAKGGTMGEKWWTNCAWDMHPWFFYMPKICDMGRKHLLITLLRLEFVCVSFIFLYIFYLCSFNYSLLFVVYFLVFLFARVHWACLFWFLFIRSHVNDYFQFYRVLQC
jgi:hypothetical protein